MRQGDNKRGIAAAAAAAAAVAASTATAAAGLGVCTPHDVRNPTERDLTVAVAAAAVAAAIPCCSIKDRCVRERPVFVLFKRP